VNWDLIEGDWERLKASAKRQWEKLTDEQLETIAGKRVALSAAIRETYGITPETTERQVSFWQSIQRPKDGGLPTVTNVVVMTLVAMIGLAHGAVALAAPMSKAEYDGARKDIESDHKSAKIGCEPMPGSVKDVCLAEVRGRHELAIAELEHAYAPSAKAQYQLRIVKARAAHSAARKQCDDKAGIAKDTCLKDNEAVSAAARTNAAAQLKTAEADDTEKARAKAGQ
jgi:uncharacterized protein YjbJ (UPF0337 family)